jgi:hypothetical protein
VAASRLTARGTLCSETHFLPTKEKIMSDDKNQRDGRDRSQVSAEEDYELDHFAEKYGLTRDEARGLIDRHGNSREKLDAAAARLRAG